MPLYYFHVRGDVSRPDMDGVDLRDAQEAWAEAVQLASDLQSESGEVFDGRQWSIVVIDDAGGLLFRLDFDQTIEDG